MKKIFFIINPIAGTKLRQLTEDQIRKEFNGADFDITIAYSTSAGDVTKLAKDALVAGFKIIAAAGGDGTINEAAKALVNTDAILAIIPVGSGNGLAHHLNVPLKVKDSLGLIKTEQITAIDVGTLENKDFGRQIFLSNFGLGYDAEVIHAYSKLKSRGFATYMFCMFKSMLTLRPVEVEIETIHTSQTLKPFVYTVANSSQYGYKIKVAPQASLRDGILDALLVRDAKFFRVLKFAIISALNKTDKVDDVAEFEEVQSVIVSPKAALKIQIDGEPYTTSNLITVGIKERSLKIFVPSIKNKNSI